MNRKSQPAGRRGFTLIELLVVISIIGILAAMAMVSFTGPQRQARDSARKSDLRQYSTLLEEYANINSSLYPQRPDSSGVRASVTLCSDLSQTGCSEDQKYVSDNTFTYKYQTDGSTSNGAATATKYVLWGKLENSTDYWVVCSTGKVGAKAQSGFAVSGGTCPI